MHLIAKIKFAMGRILAFAADFHSAAEPQPNSIAIGIAIGVEVEIGFRLFIARIEIKCRKRLEPTSGFIRNRHFDQALRNGRPLVKLPEVLLIRQPQSGLYLSTAHITLNDLQHPYDFGGDLGNCGGFRRNWNRNGKHLSVIKDWFSCIRSIMR